MSIIAIFASAPFEYDHALGKPSANRYHWSTLFACGVVDRERRFAEREALVHREDVGDVALCAQLARERGGIGAGGNRDEALVRAADAS